MSDTLKSFLDDCIAATGEKGVNVAGMIRSQLPAAIRSIVLDDYTDINHALSDILGEAVTDAFAGLAKVAAIKEAERQAIIAKGTLVTLQDAFEVYANKIRAIQSYVDLTYSGIMPNFILDPEPTGSTIVYMRPGATGDGTSWTNAMGDFVAAHASLSGSKNVIYMEEGVYPVTGNITLKSNIKIYGGFKVSDHAWSNRNSFTNRTILDAQLTELKLSGSSNSGCIIDGLTVINSRVTSFQGTFINFISAKNLIAQDCIGLNGAGFSSMNSCCNLVAINCSVTTGSGGGLSSITNSQNLVAINCSAANGGGFASITGCSGILALNCKSTTYGGGIYLATNCANAKIVNCSTTNGGCAHGDNTCKNFLIINCSAGSNPVVFNPSNCQNYTIINSVGSSAISSSGSGSLASATKIYNFVCLNNKNATGSIVGIYLATANYYYKLYNCRADTAIGFAANAATYADIKNFVLVQNDNSNTKFTNAGTYPVVGTLPYENAVINQKYIDGNFGDFNIPLDSVLAGAGYWEDGFSFGWDIDGKTRNATHCSIGSYEPHWA